MDAFTIKELENLSGIKAHTIRVWEQRYSFLKPQRTSTNIRYYTNEELKIVLNIALLNKYGYKISHINKMRPDELTEKLVSLSNSQAQQERIINELLQLTIDMDIEKLEATLNHYVAAKGIDKVITQVIFPFLEKIGILWLANHVHPAQEHLVTNIVRQKLIVGIEGAFTHLATAKTVLLYLPEGEYHELGLLYIHYLLKCKGIKVLYLGANVPMKDLELVAAVKKPDFVYTHLTTVASNFNFDKFLSHLHNHFPACSVVISGQIVFNYKKKMPSSITVCRSLTDFMDFVARM
ncbi:MAG: MerR family transcriptional regulator [Williamsia sp.]|nr:MerR family transcriptional regulator [Williamsia sp.]